MIKDTYSEIILEEIIKEILAEAESPSVSEITERYDAFVAANDISKPLFSSVDYKVVTGESFSAGLYNETNQTVLRDLRVIYKHLFKVSDQIIQNFDRWKEETKFLEGRLDDLEERIASLLLVSEDTAGYFNFMQDNFVDTSKIDLSQTSALVNLQKGIITIGTSSAGATRYDLSSLTKKDFEFTVLSKNNLISTVSASGSEITNVVNDASNFWQEKVYTNKPAPVSAELKIKLPGKLQISRIDVDFHMANSNSSVQVTPMYSVDNFNYYQLPLTNYTRSVVDKTSFQFPPIEAQQIKFIMTKVGADLIHNNQYAYEFGVDEIAFYYEGFEEETESILMSSPLSVLNTEGNPEEFSRIVLEVCEDIPENTSVDYYVAVSNDSLFPVASGNFTSIDPLTRESSSKPVVLDFGDLDSVSISGIRISYDPLEATALFVNPDKDFKIVDSVSAGTAVISTAESSSQRYSFLGENDRILDYELDTDIFVAEGTLELWRNVFTQNRNVEVRDIAHGWGFTDPYYKTIIYVENASGMDIDFGGKAVIIDEVVYTGKVTVSQGRHKVEVHKNNWQEIDVSAVTDLETLKVEDGLYPYNHKYLVEGFPYPVDYPVTNEKIYKGFDIVAEFFMKEVSVFDLIHNVASGDYEKFAIDRDALDESGTINGSPATKVPMSVFLLKVNGNNSDFMNEDFLLKFKSANTLYKYLRLKAILKTSDSNITPILESYRIKISS